MNIFTTMTQSLRNSITHPQIRNSRIKAIRSALIAANAQHPDCRGIGFDESLLLNQAAAIMDPFLNDAVLPNANELATLWATTWANANQFTNGAAQTAAANIMPMVNDFIYALTTESLPRQAQTSPTVAQPQSAYSDAYPAGAYLSA